MTKETAERAAQILREIDYLTGLYDNFFNAEAVEIKARLDDEWKLNIECKKGKNNGDLVKFIIDGIDQKILSLQEELRRL